jgi:hypothetical protein
MKSLSRQGRVEKGNHKRNIRRSTDLAQYPGFDWEPGSFIYTCLGYKIGLRFCQSIGMWTCKCDELTAQVEIIHQPPENLENALQNWIAKLTEPFSDKWLLTGLPRTRGPRVAPIGAEPMGEEISEISIDDWMTRPQEAARQSTRAAHEMADTHNIGLRTAGEFLLEKGE